MYGIRLRIRFDKLIIYVISLLPTAIVCNSAYYISHIDIGTHRCHLSFFIFFFLEGQTVKYAYCLIPKKMFFCSTQNYLALVVMKIHSIF